MYCSTGLYTLDSVMITVKQGWFSYGCVGMFYINITLVDKLGNVVFKLQFSPMMKIGVFGVPFSCLPPVPQTLRHCHL